MEDPGRLQSMGSRRVGHNWTTSLSLFTFMHWRRKWQPNSSVLAQRIPGMAEPGGLLSMGSHKVGHDWSDLAAAAVLGTFRSLLQHHSSKAYCLLYGPGLTTVCDPWEDHSLDYMDLCWQSNVCFSTQCLGLSSFSCRESIVFWFHGCDHCPQWFWNPGGGNLSHLSLFP